MAMHRLIKIFLHSFFWVIYALLAATISFDLFRGTAYLQEHIRVFLVNGVWALIAFYALYLYGFRFFERKQYCFYALGTVAFSVALTLMFFLLFKYFLVVDNSLVKPVYFYTSLPGTFIIANCGSLLKGFEGWFDAVNRKEELEKITLQHELESLRAQINPHFLFNTLNNIDALIYSNPGAASDSLVRLSEIMRYILYVGVNSSVAIQKEVEHIENIIALQSMRHVRPDFVVFKKNIACENSLVAPLLFVPFLENAFKYATYVDGQAIEIDLRCSATSLSFHCFNHYDPAKQHHSKESGGIGLANVQRRLQLLYPGRHTLLLRQEKHTFSVLLEISLVTQCKSGV
jgi:two-component system, LytTR family, sensor kinase